MRRRRPLIDRLMEKIARDPATGCWNWTGCVDRDGYGQIRSDQPGSRQVKAHRAAYELLRRVIPDGLVVDHLCRNPRCVNPDHLEPVTAGENIRRFALTITRCPHGHAFTADNTGRDGTGRCCRACKRAGYLKWYHERGGAAWRRTYDSARAGSTRTA